MLRRPQIRALRVRSRRPAIPDPILDLVVQLSEIDQHARLACGREQVEHGVSRSFDLKAVAIADHVTDRSNCIGHSDGDRAFDPVKGNATAPQLQNECGSQDSPGVPDAVVPVDVSGDDAFFIPPLELTKRSSGDRRDLA